MRTPWAVALLLALSCLGAGCSLEADEPRPSGAQAEEKRESGEASEVSKIRAWSRALNDGDFAEAASFFAEGAVVEQLEEKLLVDRDAAVAFNRSLPCRADVTDVKDEGETLVAAFRLRDGPGGPCGGAARVRFRFEDGKFAEWRQLSAPPAPKGDIARCTSLCRTLAQLPERDEETHSWQA